MAVGEAEVLVGVAPVAVEVEGGVAAGDVVRVAREMSEHFLLGFVEAELLDVAAVGVVHLWGDDLLSSGEERQEDGEEQEQLFEECGGAGGGLRKSRDGTAQREARGLTAGITENATLCHSAGAVWLCVRCEYVTETPHTFIGLEPNCKDTIFFSHTKKKLNIVLE